MKKSVVRTLLTTISLLAVAKVSLPFWAMEDVVLVQNTANIASIEQQQVMPKDDRPLYQVWSGQWLVNELIPSAEAAESMALAEEHRRDEVSAVKITALRKMRKQLDEREMMLDERETEAKKAEVRAKNKIAQLEQLETRIKELLAQEKSIKDKKIKRLTAVYEGMKAEKAAPVIAQMDLGIVVKIFSRMSEKQVGKILSFLSAKKAVVISQALTQRIGSM